MLSLVEKDMHVQDESRMPISFSDEDEKHKYLEMYKPIAESRKMRNEVLDKGEIEEEKVYDNADAFYNIVIREKIIIARVNHLWNT